MYKEDTLKASVILALKVSDKILPLEKDPIKLLIFPHHELDKHLPNWYALESEWLSVMR